MVLKMGLKTLTFLEFNSILADYTPNARLIRKINENVMKDFHENGISILRAFYF